MDGFTVEVTPSTFNLAKDASETFTVTITRTTALLDAYTGGYLTWSDNVHSVRIPLVVRPVALSVPAQLFGTGDPITYPVVFGYDW